MPVTQSYHTILVLDIERSSRAGDDQVLVRLQEGLRSVLNQAVTNVEIDERHREAAAIGDGLLVVFNPVVPTAKVVRLLLDHVSAELEKHNRLTDPVAQIRARAVVQAGQVLRNEQGIVGREVNLAYRLLESDALRAELTQAPGPLVAAVSDYVYHEVVQQRALGLAPDTFRRVQAQTKETSATMWVHSPTSGSGAVTPGEVKGPRWPWRRHLGKLLGSTVVVVLAVVAVLAAFNSRASPAPAPEPPGTTGPRSPGTTGCGPLFTHHMTNSSIEVRFCADWAPDRRIPVHEDPSPDSPVVGHIRSSGDDWYSCQLIGGLYELDEYGYQSKWWAFTLTDDVPHQQGYVSQVYFRGGENGEQDVRLEGC